MAQSSTPENESPSVIEDLARLVEVLDELERLVIKTSKNSRVTEEDEDAHKALQREAQRIYGRRQSLVGTAQIVQYGRATDVFQDVLSNESLSRLWYPIPTVQFWRTSLTGMRSVVQQAIGRIEAAGQGEAPTRPKIGLRGDLVCFLSYRYGGRTEAYAPQVESFLQLLGIDVRTAAGFEPRPITEKVQAKLQATDFVVLIIGEEGESAWTRDEINQFPKDRLIVLVEEGAEFAPGLFGDLEFIRFTQGHIGDALVKLLQGIRYIGEHMQ